MSFADIEPVNKRLAKLQWNKNDPIYLTLKRIAVRLIYYLQQMTQASIHCVVTDYLRFRSRIAYARFQVFSHMNRKIFSVLCNLNNSCDDTNLY